MFSPKNRLKTTPAGWFSLYLPLWCPGVVKLIGRRFANSTKSVRNRGTILFSYCNAAVSISRVISAVGCVISTFTTGISSIDSTCTAAASCISSSFSALITMAANSAPLSVEASSTTGHCFETYCIKLFGAAIFKIFIFNHSFSEKIFHKHNFWITLLKVYLFFISSITIGGIKCSIMLVLAGIRLRATHPLPNKI